LSDQVVQLVTQTTHRRLRDVKREVPGGRYHIVSAIDPDRVNDLRFEAHGGLSSIAEQSKPPWPEIET
jgi:hypothetical protein